jgi:hypothetical protein
MYVIWSVHSVIPAGFWVIPYSAQWLCSYTVTGKQHKNSLLLITEKRDWPKKCTRLKLFVSVFSAKIVRECLWNRHQRLQLEMRVETYIDCHAHCPLLFSDSQKNAVISTHYSASSQYERHNVYPFSGSWFRSMFTERLREKHIKLFDNKPKEMQSTVKCFRNCK